MWLEESDQNYLGNLRYYFKNPLTPMKYHVIPYLPMDGTLLMGGTSAGPIGRPLPRVHGRALGELSGAVHVHLREQGRPQGAGFSAGDLSRLPSKSEF